MTESGDFAWNLKDCGAGDSCAAMWFVGRQQETGVGCVL